MTVGLLICVTASLQAQIAETPSRSTVPSAKPGNSLASEPNRNDSPTAPPGSQATTALHPWFQDLSEGVAAAQRTKKPLFVRFGDEFCPWCKKLDSEIAGPDVQKTLAQWTLVELDPDKASEAASELAVGPIPALRILASSRRLVASHDGFLSREKLIAWLDENFDEAAAAVSDETIATGPVDLVVAARLVRQLQQRDPVVREVSMRRLLSHPEVATALVTEAFIHGKLQTRLAALDLLNEWKAPIQGVDPWRPETLDVDRVAALRQWANEQATKPYEQPAELAPEQVAAALRDMTALLQASESEADAIYARLARHGHALLPEVLRQLRQATTDLPRARLTELRYRLVASDALAVQWPDGLRRLAAADASIRREAAEELSRRATADEENLLLELFADPDPLLREASLKTLHRVSGTRAAGALVRLLHDPEPNVRAAVLKQFADQPTQAVVPIVAQYIAGEKDPDLVVHAVRVLRATKGNQAIEALVKLFDHESWRVRAEAAEAIGDCLGRWTPASAENADAFTALIQLLQDTDGFVVSRAVAALEHADLTVAVEPLAQAAARHRELAADVINVMASGANMRAKALPHLHRFCNDPEASVRAAAIRGLCTSPNEDAELVLRAGFRDSESKVRLAAAEALRTIAHSLRSHDEESDYDEWLERFQSGKGRPAWIEHMAGELENMLAAESREERLGAALTLVAIGRAAESLPTVLAVVRSEPPAPELAAVALPWLAWEERELLFGELLALKSNSDQLSQLIDQFASVRDQRILATLWRLLADDIDMPASAPRVLEALKQQYLGQLHYSDNQIQPADRKRAIADAVETARSGTPAQRIVSLVLLTGISPDDAVASANDVLADTQAGESLKRTALHCRLVYDSAITSGRFATEMLASTDPMIRKVALIYLARGQQSPAYFDGGLAWFAYPHGGYRSFSFSYLDEQTTSPELPRELKPELLRPLLSEPDQNSAAYAGYLLALLGERDGLDHLLKYYRQSATSTDDWVCLLSSAIAAIDDDSQVPLLEEIYNRFEPEENGQVRQFYWTIRSMTGPQALRLRKRIRDEVGFENLK